MSKLVNLIVVAIMVNLLLGCGVKYDQATANQAEVEQVSVLESNPNGCNLAWFNKVEKQVSTGDGQGHGPDLGSMEWRSVVEFKLGIRGKESNPNLDSDLWCDYIDKHYIRR
ncbi:hypothetical protein Shal_3091 [Shewanella halifaxensis HAW-EB4]|uniref:Lipoprotein n=1 Tax=Shewanella halifaxensis (strain HAW-EB4) TaxID=458817 RepID=B0TQ47_SHEHH|nr:hypothetical protein [Shewanella halifaxensis]ABZ77639.1 hypothetical protein Shal_3091 [Shewanella halifaxensis HAW-EB4]